jgi:hypothetical protein
MEFTPVIAYQMLAIRQKLSRLLAANGRGAIFEHHSIAFISIVALVLVVHVVVHDIYVYK